MAGSGIFSKMVLFAAIFVVLAFCGCHQAQLANGKYDTTLSGREDFVLVHNDRIAVRLRNPENDGRDGDYWSWIGDYHIENNRIWLDMDGDLEITGTVSGYDVKATAVTASEQAATNRLTVTVKISFTNRKFPEDDFPDKSFSAYADFDAMQSLDAVEASLCEEIVEQLCDDIFNATVARW